LANPSLDLIAVPPIGTSLEPVGAPDVDTQRVPTGVGERVPESVTKSVKKLCHAPVVMDLSGVGLDVGVLHTDGSDSVVRKHLYGFDRAFGYVGQIIDLYRRCTSAVRKMLCRIDRDLLIVC